MLKIIQLNFPFDKPQNNFFTNPQNSSLSCRMCTAFPVTGTNSQRQCWALELPNSHLHREGFPHQVRSLRLCGQPVDFLVWLRRLWIAFQTNSRFALKQCFQSNRYARQACENLPKVCPHKRRDLHFDAGR